MLLHLRPVMCVFSGVAGPAIILAWSVVDEPGDSVRAGAYDGEGGSRLFDRNPPGTTDQLERQKSPEETRGNSLELLVKAPVEQSHLFWNL